jgi:hypothetical protein
MADQLAGATVSWWDLAEPSGAFARAWGPVPNHGQYVGNPSRVAGGVALNGSSQYVSVKDDPSLDLTGDWTVWCQVQRGATGAIRTLMSKGGASAWQLRLDATGKPQLVVAGQVILTAANPLDANVRTVSASYGAGGYTLWSDGLGVQVAHAARVAANALPLTLGCDTAANGLTRSQYYNGTIRAAAVLNQANFGGASGPIILVALPAGQFLDVPVFTLAYRDPADQATALAVAGVPIQVLTGRSFLQGGWTVQWSWAGGAWNAIALDANGAGTIPVPAIAPPWNGVRQQLMVRVIDTGGQPASSWESTALVDVGLARLVPNLTLGANVANLGASWAVLPDPANALPDGGAVFFRAMVGPGPTDYAPGSAWRSSAAAVQADLPAQGAYLAAQVQLVRRT